jgi:perosamine synthetase
MSLFREIPPTAGLPLYLDDFFHLNKQGCLEDDFKRYLGVPYVKTAYSGTAALYLILEALKEISPKRTVIISSYICPLLPLGIKRAGFQVEVCDINGKDFNFDPASLELLCSGNKDIAAIVAAHIAGIPLDLDSIRDIVKKYDIRIIEDCAQSLGAVYKGKKTGAIGDFSFFSLCRGKGLTIYEGGVLATTEEEFVPLLDRKAEELSKDGFLCESLKILELFGYWIFYRPRLFWFVFRLPQIFWKVQGKELKAFLEYYTIDFPLHKVSWFRRSVGHAGFTRLETAIAQQRKKVSSYLEALSSIRGIEAIKESPGSRATYPYLTLIFDEAKRRQRAMARFEGSGLGISQVYVHSIVDYEYLRAIVPDRDCPGGRYLSERQMTLSTSLFLEPKDMTAIIKILKEI